MPSHRYFSSITILRLTLAGIALAISAVVIPATCQAGFVVEVQNVTTRPGSLGSFDVVLANTGTTAYDVSADTVEISLNGLTGVQFTGATIGTTKPYIYVLSGTVVPPSSPLSFDSFPNVTFTASDAEFGPLGYREVDPGAVFGLVHVTYSVAGSTPLASGSVSIVAAGTSFADAQFNSIGFTTQAGTFNVVPEPASILLLLIGGISVVMVASRRKSSLIRRIR